MGIVFAMSFIIMYQFASLNSRGLAERSQTGVICSQAQMLTCAIILKLENSCHFWINL
jgi:hypothetical protein